MKNETALLEKQEAGFRVPNSKNDLALRRVGNEKKECEEKIAGLENERSVLQKSLVSARELFERIEGEFLIEEIEQREFEEIKESFLRCELSVKKNSAFILQAEKELQLIKERLDVEQHRAKSEADRESIRLLREEILQPIDEHVNAIVDIFETRIEPLRIHGSSETVKRPLEAIRYALVQWNVHGLERHVKNLLGQNQNG